jgi:hypothetical protein
MMRKWTAIWLASLITVAGLTSVLMGAQARIPPFPQTPPSSDITIFSGSDIGFRVDNAYIARTGKVVGTLVVRVNGNWVEVGLGPKFGMATGN